MDIYTLATSVIPDTSLAFTMTVIIAGLGIVLTTLLLLVLVFKLYGKIMEKSQQRQKKKQAQKQLNQMQQEVETVQTAPAPTSAKSVVQEGISGEIIAAISAAVYAMEGPDAVIRSVTRKKSPVTSRNPWAQAAINDNTRPF